MKTTNLFRKIYGWTEINFLILVLFNPGKTQWIYHHPRAMDRIKEWFNPHQF